MNNGYYHTSDPILLESCNPIGRETGANSLDHCRNSITLGNNAIIPPLNNDVKKNSSNIPLPQAARSRQRLGTDWQTEIPALLGPLNAMRGKQHRRSLTSRLGFSIFGVFYKK